MMCSCNAVSFSASVTSRPGLGSARARSCSTCSCALRPACFLAWERPEETSPRQYVPCEQVNAMRAAIAQRRLLSLLLLLLPADSDGLSRNFATALWGQGRRPEPSQFDGSRILAGYRNHGPFRLLLRLIRPHAGILTQV